MRRFRALVVLACVAGVVAGLPPSATGKTPAFSGFSRGVSAWAGWEDCTQEYCSSFVDLYAFQGMDKYARKPFRGTTVCFSSYSERSDVYESGCTSAPRGTLTVAKDLSWGILRPTDVSLVPCTYDYETDEEICYEARARTVTVSAEWTGEGRLSRSFSRYMFRDDECMESYWDRGIGRDATARGAVNGASLGVADYAGLQKGMTKFRSTCPYYEP